MTFKGDNGGVAMYVQRCDTAITLCTVVCTPCSVGASISVVRNCLQVDPHVVEDVPGEVVARHARVCALIRSIQEKRSSLT